MLYISYFLTDGIIYGSITYRNSFKNRQHGYNCFCCCYINMMTGILLLMARILESSSSMHAWIDSFYIDGVVKGQIETAQLMDKIPALYILLVILGILELMMVKSSGIRHIKMFSKNKQTNAVVFLMPALVIYVWEGFIRRNILSEIIKMVIHKE